MIEKVNEMSKVIPNVTLAKQNHKENENVKIQETCLIKVRKRKGRSKGKRYDEWIAEKSKKKSERYKKMSSKTNYGDRKKTKGRKEGSNLKNRLFRKSRKSRKDKVPQPLSSNPLKFDFGTNASNRSSRKCIKKKIALDVMPLCLSTNLGTEYLQVVSGKMLIQKRKKKKNPKNITSVRKEANNKSK